MLSPNIIPSDEPQINIGIILPEDNIRQLELQLPTNPGFQIITDTECFDPGYGLILKLTFIDNTIQIDLNGKKIYSKNEIKIIPKEKAKPSNHSAIKAGPVIAGRGFHWQKYIDVFLPDTLIFKIFKNSLILINQVSLEHYVMCVATSEMSAECPKALIEAQTIAARSWLLANVEQKHRHMEMDICNDDCCQRYQGSTFLTAQSMAGALNTSGQVLMYNNRICDARYSKSCGGMMEAFGAIWPGNEEDYLQAIPDTKGNLPELRLPLSQKDNFFNWVNSAPETFCSPKVVPEATLKKYLGSVDEEGLYFRWQFSISQEELTATIKTFTGVPALFITRLEAVSRGASGRINKLDIHYLDQNNEQQIFQVRSEYNVRRFLSKKFLLSSAFIIEPVNVQKNIPQSFKLTGAGWGHGVGLCQIGALGMALKGFATSDILSHYYPGSKLSKLY